MKNNKLAFTLIEMLLVVAIIGVVGTLAVSNSKKDMDTAEKVTQLRKTYEIVEAAIMSAIANSGNPDTWSQLDISDGADQYSLKTSFLWSMISGELKLIKNCGTSKGCWKDTKQYKLDNSEDSISINDTNSSFHKGILSNGASIAVSSCDSESYSEAQRCFDYSTSIGSEQTGIIYVDVNGPDKGLNKHGDDIFCFRLFKDGQVTPYKDTNLSRVCTRGEYCTAWVIQFGNEDYLKIKTNDDKCSDGKKLSWNGNHTCKK